MAKLFTDAFFTAIDSDGEVISGAKWNFYETGTTTRQNTYTDNALSVAHANPVVANIAGRFAPIYLQDADYKAVLTDAADVTIKTIDPVHGGLDSQLFIDVKRDHGAKGDGSTDDRVAIQAAIDEAGDAGGGIVWFPPVDVANDEYYRIAGKPLLMRDNVILTGAGKASLIRNDDTSGTDINEYTVLFGWSHPDHTEDDYTKYTIADTVAGQMTVTTDTPADAGNFTVGGLITVMNGLNYLVNSKPRYHDYTLTRVTSVDAGTGVIGLEHALNVAYVTSGAVSPQIYDLNEAGVTFDHGFAAFGTQRAGLYNLGLQSEGRITAHGGTLESYFGNLWIDASASVVYANLWAHCVVENIWTRTGNRLIEIKEGCHDNTIRNIHGQFEAGAAGTPNTPIDIGESARNNLIDGWFIDMGDVDPATDGVRFSSCKHNRVINGKFQTGTFNGNIATFSKSSAGSPDDMRCEGNAFSHNVVSAQVAVARFWDFVSHSADAVRHNRVEFNQFAGSAINDAGRLEGTENYVLFNYHQSGIMNWAGGGGGGATKNFIVGNSFPDGANPSASGLHSDLAANYAWMNVDAGGFSLSFDSERFGRAITADFTIPDQANGFSLTNAGAAGTVTVTLPVAVRGKRFRGYREATQAFRFDPNGSEQIRQNNGTLAAAGKYAEIGSDDGYLDFICLVDGIWFLAVEVGTINIEP